MAKKQILVLTSTFPRWRDDFVPARFVYDLCQSLRDRFDFTVLAPHDPGAALNENLNGIRVLRHRYFLPESKEFICNGIGIMPNVRSSFLGKIQAACLIASQRFALRRLLREEHFDVIHSHWLIPSGMNVVHETRRYPVPHVTTVHSSDLHFLRRFAWGRRIVRNVQKNADSIFVVSQYLKGLLDGIVERDSMAEVKPMGVFTHQFHPSNPFPPRPPEFASQKLVIYVGKLIEVKGVEYLLEAFAKVRQRIPNATLMLIGDGNRRRSLEKLADHLKLTTAVHFLGPKPHDELRNFYHWADVVVLSSIVTARGETEGMPVVIFEALASGAPVVATRISSVEDVVVEGENGALAPPADGAALADAILRVLQHSTPGALRAKALTAATKFDWEIIATAYADAYNRLSS